jgi:hypothetical protein
MTRSPADMIASFAASCAGIVGLVTSLWTGISLGVRLAKDL